MFRHLIKNGNEDCKFVFQVNGTHLHHNAVRKHFKKMLTKAELDDMTFHDLRHNNAAYSLMSGTDYKSLQYNLGHATPEFTLNIYGHIVDEMRTICAERLNGFLIKLLRDDEPSAIATGAKESMVASVMTITLAMIDEMKSIVINTFQGGNLTSVVKKE